MSAHEERDDAAADVEERDDAAADVEVAKRVEAMLRHEGLNLKGSSDTQAWASPSDFWRDSSYRLCGNQPVRRCTRQFFNNSFLGDDAAVLARSSGEEPAQPRHRAGVASMAWRTTR